MNYYRMTTKISVKENDCLDIDSPIAGQNYACISFVSPDDILKQKELFMYNKYMNQVCKEFDDTVEELTKKAGEEYNNKITKELRNKLQYHFKYDYDQFKSKFDDFKYKYHDDLEQLFNKKTDFKTSVRGVKVRGVYDTYMAAEKQAKRLQQSDSSFHVFVGNVGYWLPWDPCADRIENEEYLEDELNTLIHKYKENAVHKDMMYEQEKRDKIKAAAEENLRAKQAQETPDLTDEDPWMKSKFNEATNTDDDNTGDNNGPKVI